MIRPTRSEDTPLLLKLAEATKVFKPQEIVALEEVLDDYFATTREQGHLAVTWEQGGEVLGFAYYAPSAMADRTWYLWWIAVRKSEQAKGIGGRLLQHAEEDVKRRRGRMLLIETSSLPHYAKTRAFYGRRGYEVVARVPDFYAEGDDRLILAKRIQFTQSGQV